MLLLFCLFSDTVRCGLFFQQKGVFCFVRIVRVIRQPSLLFELNRSTSTDPFLAMASFVLGYKTWAHTALSGQHTRTQNWAWVKSRGKGCANGRAQHTRLGEKGKGVQAVMTKLGAP